MTRSRVVRWWWLMAGGLLTVGGCWTSVYDRDTGERFKAQLAAAADRDVPIAITRSVRLSVQKFDETRRIGAALARGPHDEPAGTTDLSGRVAACLQRHGYTHVTYQPGAAAAIYVAAEVGRPSIGSLPWLVWSTFMAVPGVVGPVPLYLTQEMPLTVGLYDEAGRLLARRKRFITVGLGGVSAYGLVAADECGAIAEAVCVETARLIAGRHSAASAPASSPLRGRRQHPGALASARAGRTRVR